jgi:hypothetical protein
VAAIELGDHFLPQVTALVEWITGSALPGIIALSSWIGDHLAPALAAVGHVWQQVTAAFQGGGLLAAVGQILSDLGTFAQSMFTAGWNLVATFGQGMMQAAESVVTAVVNDIAGLIAGFFVGNSPPPNGPLSQIDKGGQNTMQAFIDGMKAQLNAGGLTAIASQVDATFKGMATGADFSGLAAQVQNTTAQLAALKGQADGTAAAAKTATANIKETQSQLQAETSQLTTALDGVNAQIQTNTDEQKILKGIVSDITDSYKSQLDPLQADLANLQSQVDYAGQLRDANEAVRMAQLDQAILNDQGDASKRAALQLQLSNLQAQQHELDIKSQIANLEAQKKQAAGNPDKLAALNLQLQELGIQQQIADLVNKPQLAADQAAKAQLAATLAQQAADAKVAAAKKAAAEAADKQKIAAIKAEEAAKLKPYQDQLEALTNQATVLNAQKQQWTDLKGQIQAASQQASSLASGIQAAAGHLASLAGTAAKIPKIGGAGVGGPGAGAGGPVIDPTKIASDFKTAMNTAMQATIATAQQKAQEAARAWLDGFGQWLAAHKPDPSGWAPAYVALNAAYIGKLAELLGDIGNWVLTMAPVLAQKFLVWGDALVAWISPRIEPLLAMLERYLAAVGQFIGSALPIIQADIARWGQAFTDWVQPAATSLLTAAGALLGRLGGWIQDSAAPAIGAQLQSWVQAFTAWIVPAASTMRDNLGPMLDSLGGWIASTALPAIQQQLETWGQAFTTWVAPAALRLLEEAAKLLTQLLLWVTFIALPTIIGKLLEWGLAFVQWVAPRIPELLAELGTLLLALTTWLLTTALPDIAKALLAIGKAIVQGIMEGLAPLGQQLQQALLAAIDGININVGPFHLSSHGFSIDMPQMPNIPMPSIPHFAGGTNYAPGGLAVVGEYGPELVNLPRGSEVFPNGQAPTSALRPASGGSGGNIYVTVTGNTILNDQDAARLATIIGRHLVQQTGAAYSLAGLGGR